MSVLLYVCLCTHAPGGQRRVPDAPELEFQMAQGPVWVLATEPGSPERVASVFLISEPSFQPQNALFFEICGEQVKKMVRQVLCVFSTTQL